MKLQYEPVQLHLSHLYGCSPVCRRRWFIRLSDLWNNSEWMNGWMNKLMNVTYVQYMCWLFLQWVKEKVKYRKERDLLYVLEAPHYIKTDKKSWTHPVWDKKREWLELLPWISCHRSRKCAQTQVCEPVDVSSASASAWTSSRNPEFYTSMKRRYIY
mgnify:CR=1 FL=1